MDAPGAPRRLAPAMWWTLAGLWTFAVAFVCLLRGTWVSQWIKAIMGFSSQLGLKKELVNDHVLHCGSFLVLGLLYATALGEGSWRRIDPRAWVRTGGALLALAVVLELLQHFVPGRTVDAADLSANLLGVCAGFSAPRLVSLRRNDSTAPLNIP